MDPLDCTLDELANHSRKRSRKVFNNHNNTGNNHNAPRRKRLKTDHYNKYNSNNHNYNTYNTNNHNRYHNSNRNRNRNRHYDNNYYAPNQNRYNNNSNYNDNNARYNRNQIHTNNAPQQRTHNNKMNRFQSHVQLPSPPHTNYYIASPETKEETKQDTNRYGYVTLIMRGDNYIPGALILAHSLRLVNTKYSLIAMVTNDVSSKARDTLQLLYDHVIEVPYIKHKCKPMKTEKQKEKYNTWATDSFTKWNILQINTLLNITFEKLLFLDSDKIVIKNIDSLFTDANIKCPAGTFSSPWTNKRSDRGLIDYYPHNISHGQQIPASAIYNALYKNGFVAVGTGMLLKPNMNHFNKFIQMLTNKWICNEYMDNDIEKEKIKLRRLNNKFKVKTNDIDDKKNELKTKDDKKNELKTNDDKKNELKTNDDIILKQNELKTKDDKKNELKTNDKKNELKTNGDKKNKLKTNDDDIQNNNRLIGFKNCYSMLDEQSIVFFYYYHRIAWNYIDTKYNFIPWHFKWLETETGVLDIPVVLHFFGMKPWDLSPLEWRDLQVWWGLVFNLVNYACDENYKWNEKQKELIASFFKLNFINELPLDLFIEDENENNNANDFNIDENEMKVHIKGRGLKGDGLNEGDDRKAIHDAKLKLKSKVICFWCYELAKRQKLDPVQLIKNNDFDTIDWIFHCPIDPLTGILCCPKLMKNTSNY